MVRVIHTVVCCLALVVLNAQQNAVTAARFQSVPRLHRSQIDSCIQQAVRDYTYLSTQLDSDRFPSTFNPATKTIKTTGSEPWVGGFYPGSLLYLYEATGDTLLYNEAMRKLKVLEKEKTNTTSHDLGFMMNCSFGNAYRLKPDDWYKQVMITSAKSLASRFNEKVGCIRSWNSKPDQFMVIIDNMMNLELLFAATRLTGDSSFYKIAVTHANTTIANHFRPDYSSYHLVIYDPQTGKVQKKQTVQGAADESAWARGQAWGLYGFTMTYRETKDKKYLQQATHIAEYMLKHLPNDAVFYWDFNAPATAPAYRDASATAIACSALQELSKYVDRKTGRKYMAAATAMLKALSSPEYLATPKEYNGFILKHGVGNLPHNSEIDVPLIYADYYYIEALMRYRKLTK
jgi:uncharacterized protein YyaL (SSP411 family)